MISKGNFTKLAAASLAVLVWFASPNVLAGDLEMELSCEPVGVGTPGYWMTHPEAWPPEIEICGVTYTAATAIPLMQQATAGDKWLTMFQALVATKLNLLNGTEWRCCQIDGLWYCIPWVVNTAECWLVDNPSPVEASSDAWQDRRGGEYLYDKLDAYNNGELCAPSRDELEELEDEIEAIG
jgi:hypothetical protein